MQKCLIRNLINYNLEYKIVLKVTSKLSLNAVGDYYDENNFLHKLLLTNTQVSELRKAFENDLSANIKL